MRYASVLGVTWSHPDKTLASDGAVHDLSAFETHSPS